MSRKRNINKLSKHERNQKELETAHKQKIEKTQTDEMAETKYINKRTYSCSCGCEVTLFGEIGKQKIKNGFELCSSCSQ